MNLNFNDNGPRSFWIDKPPLLAEYVTKWSETKDGYKFEFEVPFDKFEEIKAVFNTPDSLYFRGKELTELSQQIAHIKTFDLTLHGSYYMYYGDEPNTSPGYFLSGKWYIEVTCKNPEGDEIIEDYLTLLIRSKQNLSQLNKADPFTLEFWSE